MNADDIVVAIIIAIIVVIILAYVRFRLHPGQLEGYWGTLQGGQYQIRVLGGGDISVTGPEYRGRGQIRPLRGLCIGDGEKTRCASLDLEGRWLTWSDNGEIWIKQGPPAGRRWKP